MIAECFPYFVQEMTKHALQLSDEERKRQAVQFGALGTLAAPVAAGLGNLITHGKVAPWSKGLVGKSRWLAGRMAGGLVGGAALPYAQHAIERGMQGDAQERLRRMRISRALKEYHRQVGGEDVEG